MSDPAAPPVRIEKSGNTLIVTLDNPPVNVIGQSTRAGLLHAIDRAEAEGVDRLVITGAGAAFAAGADAREFDAPPQPPHLPDVLLRLERLPAIAAINGAALGGGLEIALACRMRIAAPSATLGLPEVTLGVVPGAGGTQRLPRLVGLSAALTLIPEGRVIPAAEALSLGLVDQLADDPLAAALTAPVPPAKDRPAPAPDPAAVDAARQAARRRMKGQTAPLVAIDLIEAAVTAPLADGLARERAAFLTLREGDQARALRHAFFAERAAQSRARAYPAPARDMAHAVVVGGGTMGAGIALALANAGLEVTTLERDPAAVAKAREVLAGLYQDSVRRGKLTSQAMDHALATRHRFTDSAASLPSADIAIEAVFEDLAVKRDVFARLAAALPDTTILATNTSYLDVNAIFDGLPNPGRCLGLHFFAPAHVMKLLEVIRAQATTPETLGAAFTLARRLRKISVEAGLCDGFIGNRILTRYRQTTDVMLIEGALPLDVDTAMEGFGMAMGPYAVQDLSGLDIAYANRQRKNLRAQPGLRYIPIADRMVEDLKRLGRKTGAGWFDYPEGRPVPSAIVDDLVRRTAAEAGIPRRTFTADEITRRALLAMIAEGLAILDEGIARSGDDIDLVLLHGYGFPRWRGGPMHLARAMGLPALRDALQALAAEDPLSWRVPPLLDRLVATAAPLP